jgi:two-component system, chemotaxis family, sensor kinase CheA
VTDELDELRRIFREEVDDHAATLRRESAALKRAATDDDTRTAAREIYRAVHSLKGAARAVDVAAIEQAAHDLETELDAALGGEISVDRVTAVADSMIETLAEWTGDDAPPAEPSEPAPASSRATPEAAPDAKQEPAAAETVRVALTRLSALTDASEELVGAASRSHRDAKAIDDAMTALRGDVARARHLGRRSNATDLVSLLDRSLATLQTLRLLLSASQSHQDAWQRAIAGSAREVVDHARALRIVPLATLAPALERTALDAARASGKTIEFRMLEGTAEVDRRIRDGLRDVLMHLVRNAVDHGIEAGDERRARGKPVTGRVTVKAEVVGREVRVVVADDGRGIDLAAVREAASRAGRKVAALDDRAVEALLFEPGLTTRAEVSALSGRGMGLDIVRQRVSELHGRVEIERKGGPGTAFVVLVPLDLGVLRGLIVLAGDTPVVLPTTSIVRLRRLRPEDIRSVEGSEHVEDDGAVLPLVALAEALGLSRARRVVRAEDGASCVIVGSGERRAAVAVEGFADERDLVVRSPSAHLRRAPFVAGVTLLDDGEVAVVVDVAELVYGGRARSPQRGEATPKRRRVLVVDDSITTRQLVRSILEAAGYEVVVAHDGEQAWTLLTNAAVDVVVSDIEMPRLDGFQLLARLRSHSRLSTVPVVLVTALEREVDRQRATDLGASAYITKGSFDQDELLATLEAVA